jgi:hypothetical protein
VGGWVSGSGCEGREQGERGWGSRFRLGLPPQLYCPLPLKVVALWTGCEDGWSWECIGLLSFAFPFLSFPNVSILAIQSRATSNKKEDRSVVDRAEESHRGNKVSVYNVRFS